jgi:hypothetical protein
MERKFSKISIFILLTLFLSVGFSIPRFSNAQTEGTVYFCPSATSLEEINPRCPGKIILKLGETINGLTLTTTIYEDKEYYLVLGFTNGGGGVNLPPTADANGPYQGDAGLPITLDASNSSDPNNDSLQYRWDFDDDGIWDTEWLNTSTINYIWNNDYEGNVKLEVSDGEFTATDTATVKVKSAKWLKQNAISELELAKTGNKKNDKEIDAIIGHIQNSLDNDLWIDSSHLIFFKKDCLDSGILDFDPEKLDIDGTFELESGLAESKMKSLFKGKCFGPKLGLRVFYEEYIATKLISNGKSNFAEEIIGKLIKADYLLAKIAIFDAKNTPVQNPKLQKIIMLQIERAEKELENANKELNNNKPPRAILRLAKSWLHAQLAIKLTNLKVGK